MTDVKLISWTFALCGPHKVLRRVSDDHFMYDVHASLDPGEPNIKCPYSEYKKTKY